MTKQKFIRQDWMRHLKFGKHSKKLRKWRSPKGTHSKMRRKRRNYPACPTVGYKSPRKESGKIQGYSPILIRNLKELNNLRKSSAIIISKKIGVKKKIALIKKASDMNIKILNVKQEKI